MTAPNAKPASLLRDSGAFSIATFLSRIFGYLRDAALAAAVPTELTDLFLACFRLPNTFRRLFGEGAVSVAFIPTFTRVHERSREEARRLFGATLSVVAVATLAVVVVGVVFAPEYLPFYLDLPAGGENGARLEAAREMLLYMFPYLTLICLAAVVTGVLNTRGSFFVPAVNPLFFNLSILVATGCYWRFADPSLAWLGMGVLVGGILQLLVLLPPLKRTGCLPVFSARPTSDPNLKSALTLFLPATLTLGVTQINQLVNTKFALEMGDGPNSYLYYADRIAELPLGIFGIAIAAAAFPRFSKGALEADRLALKAPLLNSLRGVLLVNIPSIVGLWVLAEPMVSLFFNRGEFAAAGGVEGTAAPLRVYVLGLVSFTCVKIYVNLSYALGDSKTPIVAGLSAAAANLFFAYWLRFTWLEHSGIALAVVIGATVNLLATAWRLRREIPLGWCGELIRPFARITLASLVMGAGVHLFLHLAADRSDAVQVLGGAAFGGFVYAGLGWRLFPDLLTPFLRRFRRG